MNTFTSKSRLLVFAVLLALMAMGQLVYAQEPDDCAVEVPQWVIDRQQYETSFVYVPAARDVEAVPIPQWVIDRQQYETSFVYVPTMRDMPATASHCPEPDFSLAKR